MRKVKIFTGSSHPELSALIIERLGIPAAPATMKRSSNAETTVEIGVSVRNEDVYIIQSGSMAINDHLMELLIMINACKISSARRITAVLPYFPYNKQSKKKKARGAITAKLVANMLATAGVDHIITMDLHSSQIQGFFKSPVDNLVAEPCIARFIRERYPNYKEGVVISKNAGGAKRVTSLADKLQIDFALIHRERYHIPQEAHKKGDDAAEGMETRLTLVGNVKGRICFMLDDIIDGTHSFLDAAEHLKRCGASTVVIIATHGILSANAVQEIHDSAAVDAVVVTNTYPIPAAKRDITKKLHFIDVSGVLSEAIRRTHNGESISYLFTTAI
ncbi:phosphoribosyltransferase-like protein [Phlyctochytrium arcticum]|nr:phosphoribosyltransferase-like protein [Phlyctochytrium arcticum]